jgi:hypothetical protein
MSFKRRDVGRAAGSIDSMCLVGWPVVQRTASVSLCLTYTHHHVTCARARAPLARRMFYDRVNVAGYSRHGPPTPARPLLDNSPQLNSHFTPPI